MPAKRALHGSRKASASCLRKTGRRGRRPLPCAYGALHSSASTIGGGGPRQRWKEFAGYILRIAKVIGVFPCGGSYHEEYRQSSNITDFFICVFHRRHSISASSKVSFRHRWLLHPTSSGAPSRREPQDARILRGMGFARSICNTNAKLARKS